MVYVLCNRLFRDKNLAGITALFFAIHPSHEWNVRFITGRCDLLQVFFSLAALIVFIDYLKAKGPKSLTLSGLFYVFAFLSREAALILPLYHMLIAYYVTGRKRETIRSVFPFLILGAVLFIARQIFFPIIVNGGGLSEGLSFQAIFEWLVFVYDYSIRLVLPMAIQFFLPPVLRYPYVGVIAVLFFLVTARYFRKKGDKQTRKVLYFGIVWMAISFLPAAIVGDVIKHLGPTFSEQYLYFAVVGYAMVLSLIILQCLGQNLQAGAIVLIAVFYLGTNVFTNHYWKSAEMFERHVAQMDGAGKYMAAEQLLMRYDDDPVEIQKMVESQQSTALKSIWLRRLGVVLRNKGDQDRAFGIFRDAVKMNHENIDAVNSLAIMYLERGDSARGIEYLNRALNLDPAYADTHRILGAYYFRQGDFTKSFAHIERANFYDPDNKEVILHLALDYLFLGQKEKYARIVEKIFAQSDPQKFDLQLMMSELTGHGYEAEAYAFYELMIKQARKTL